HVHGEHGHRVHTRMPGEKDDKVGTEAGINLVGMDKPPLNLMELIRSPVRSGESLQWSVEQRLDMPPDVDARRVQRGVNEGDLHHTIFGADQNKRA
ncbi:MAG: hypothetical protein NT112_06155, partial [Methanoregula sp.]|nr:hypothetical protein [Methanoregula sp.]